MPTNNASQYWANDTADNLHGSLKERITNYYNFTNQTLITLWRQSYRYYNAAAFTRGRLQITGDNNEYTKLGVNHYRNLIEHSVVMAINQRPAWEPRAVNTDTESQSQTILARGLLDYYMREKHLERKLKQALTYASCYAEGFITTTWNATSGKQYAVDPDTKIAQYEGDIEYEVFAPIDVIRDPTLYSSNNNQWYIVRSFKNKWDLIAKYASGDTPEDTRVRGAIMSCNGPIDPKTILWYQPGQQILDNDQIAVYTFFHDRTDAVPDGRQTLFTDDVILTDGPLASRTNPVKRVCAGELEGTTFGYTSNYDLLSIQQMIDVLYSTISSNQAAFGVQNIVSARGAGTTVSEVRDGMNLIEYDPSGPPPAGLNLVNTPPEIFNFVKMLEQVAETISGVNSVARGNPEASLKSGAALALVQSMAVQFAMGLQSSYIQLLEDVGSDTIEDLRTYASVPRIALIAGKSKRGMMTEFSGKDLSQINRVQVDAGNPMTKTVSGRVELGTMMLQAKLISTPDELLQVIQTGNLEPLVEGKTNELLSLKKENEMLADGQPVKVLVTDLHDLHIQEHKCVLSDPISRQDPTIVETVLGHIMEHLNILKDPQYAEVLQLLGQKPVQSQQMPQQGAQALQAGAKAAGGPESANGMAQSMLPGLPGPPKNAMTGEPAQLPPGAAVAQ